MLKRLLAWYNSNLLLDSEQRGLFYRAMEAQLNAGIAAQRACETLAGVVEISKEISKVAHLGAKAGKEGRLVIDGLGDSLCFPGRDLGVLRVAERNNRLGVAFGRLARDTATPLSIRRNVVSKCGYFLVIFVVLLVAAINVSGTLEGLAGDSVESVPAYGLSLFLQNWWMPGAAVLGGWLALVLGYGRGNWLGAKRRLLLMFDGDVRARFGIDYAELAESLYEQGASHTDVLEAANDAFGSDAFPRWALQSALRDHAVDGVAIERALAGRVLPAPLAELVAAMAPDGERERYPGAFAALAKIQRAVLERRYGAAAVVLRAVFLVSAAGLLLTLGHGLYTSMMLVTQSTGV